MKLDFSRLVPIVVVHAHVIQFDWVTTCCSCMNAGLVVVNLNLGFRV